MNIYRLDPIDSGRSSWQYSEERNCVWACAGTPGEARALVAAKTGFARLGAPDGQSPWQDETVTSCVVQPTMTIMRAGDVIRQDGSPVDYENAQSS